MAKRLVLFHKFRVKSFQFRVPAETSFYPSQSGLGVVTVVAEGNLWLLTKKSLTVYFPLWSRVCVSMKRDSHFSSSGVRAVEDSGNSSSSKNLRMRKSAGCDESVEQWKACAVEVRVVDVPIDPESTHPKVVLMALIFVPGIEHRPSKIEA